nr:30S ribosomal protein S21 [Phycisphaerae bacterium]NIR66133.1 30S ribosomal protein S21 [candidate division Zixibacteria bacterium]NIT57450.1 30S ribosomal protein S21 [Fodinibius sp.]NIW47281.1 30S ribosomal protein S21 [Gammaproteobacteria bacterium]NIS47756.1 30S ribosomal protein S21 [candidate division Zixibacteria bacterium]
DKSLDKAISLLRKKMAKEGIFVEMKRRSHFVKPSEIYRLKKKEQIRRHQLKNKKK